MDVYILVCTICIRRPRLLFVDSDNYYNYYLISTIILTLIAFTWFLADANDLNYTPSTLLKIGVIAAGIFVLPYYIIKFKGWRRSMVSFGKVFVFILLYIGYATIIEYVYENTISQLTWTVRTHTSFFQPAVQPVISSVMLKKSK